MHVGTAPGMRTVAIYIAPEAASRLECEGGGVEAASHASVDGV